MSKEAPLTVSVPEAGEKYFGLCRNAAYDAARRGDIPTIKIGRLLRVPIRVLERMLDRAIYPKRCSSGAIRACRPSALVGQNELIA